MENRKVVKVRFLDYWSGFPASRDEYLPLKLLRKHYEVEVCDDADYVFFSVFGESHWTVPDRCVKIFHTGENLAPDFNACDYAIGFEWMEYADRYLRFPLYLFYDRAMLDKAVGKHLLPEGWDLGAEKTGFCSFVVSNPDNPVRNRAFDALSAYRTVDSGGRYRNNVGGPVADKLAFEKSHKFSLCFENGSHSGYTTEKLVEAFAARTVPIYWGDPDVSRVFNPKAFIDASAFASPEDLVKEVARIDADDALYMAYLREPMLQPDAPSVDSQIRCLENWLTAIFDQPLEKAWRRNREQIGKRYIRERQVLNRMDRLKNLFTKGR